MRSIEVKKKHLGIGVILILVAIGIYTMGQQSVNPQVIIETNKGNIIVELYQSEAPQTVENFLSYVDDEFYSGLVFHRVIDGFMVQGGGFFPEVNQKETKSPIAIESNNGLKNERGTIAMARTNDPNSATSQFFINLVNNNFLDYKNAQEPGYTVFGKVVEGMDVVDAISDVRTSTKNGYQDWPVEDVLILSVKRA